MHNLTHWIGAEVEAPGNMAFGGWRGRVLRLSENRGYVRVVFPGHPWQRAGWSFNFQPHELRHIRFQAEEPTNEP